MEKGYGGFCFGCNIGREYNVSRLGQAAQYERISTRFVCDVPVLPCHPVRDGGSCGV